MKFSVYVALEQGLAIESSLDNASSLDSNIQRIVTVLQAPPGQYGLYLESSKKWVTEADIRAPDYSTWLPNHAVLRLKMPLDALARIHIQALNSSDDTRRRRALAELKKDLATDEFIGVFVENGGVGALSNAALSMQGNTLASCLSAIAKAISHGGKLDEVSPEALKIIVAITDPPVNANTASNANIRCPAMRVAAGLALNPAHGFQPVHNAVIDAAEKEGRKPYAGVLSCFGSSEVNMKIDALALLNALLEGGQESMLKDLRQLGITRKLQQQLGVDDEGLKQQMIKFQHAIFQTIDRLKEEQFDATVPEHVAMLNDLWTTLFPDRPFPGAVSDQWGLLGFQSNEPGQEFRSVGILGLQNLLYFAENYTDKLRNIISAQSSTEGDEAYPVAVVGVSITELLAELLLPTRGTIKPKLFPLFFDSDSAWEELYCLVFQLLDKTWDEMEVAFIDYPSVLAAVKHTVADIIKDAETLQAFKRGISSGVNRNAIRVMEQGTSAPNTINLPQDAVKLEEDALNSLKNQAHRLAQAIAKKRFLNILRDGAVMKEVKKGKPQVPFDYSPDFMRHALLNRAYLDQGFIWITYDNDSNCLKWGPTESPTTTFLNETAFSLDLDDVLEVVSGNDLTNVYKKKLDDEFLQRGLSLTKKTGEDGLDLLAQKTNACGDWADGLRVVLGKPPKGTNTLEELNTLVSADIASRIISLQGLQIPKTPPTIPDLPEDVKE